MRARITVGKADLEVVTAAVIDAMNAHNMERAERLDMLARKMNAAMSNATANRTGLNGPLMPRLKPITWREVPSVIDTVREMAERGRKERSDYANPTI